MGAGGSGEPFVGRSADLHALTTLATSAMAGGPAGGFVMGAPGLGKSRLLAEVAGTVDRPWIRMQGYQTTSGIALGAAGTLLRALARAPEVGTWLDALVVGEAGKALAPESIRLFEIAFRCVLRLGPVAIVADDLQWMDRETLSLLQYLIVAAQSAGAPLFVLCASRPSPVSAPFAAQFSTALPSDRFVGLELGPLEERDGIGLLKILIPGVTDDRAAELWRRAVGSPFWMAALAADAVSGSGRHISPAELIRTRCSSLGPDPASLFALLLVAAQPLSTAALGELLRWPDDRVGDATLELVNRALVLHGGGALSVAHDLIRESASPELGEEERLRMHGRLAQWLERSAGEDVRLLSRALEHRVASGLDGLELALRIARSPQRRLLGAEGLAVLAEIADSGVDPRRSALQMEVAALASEIGDWVAALERWSVLADRVVGPERARAALGAAEAALKLGRPFEVHAFASTARTGADGDPLLAIEADCMDVQSLLWLEGRVEQAQPLVAGALAASQKLLERAGGIAALSDPESAIYVKAVRGKLDAAIRRADAEEVGYCAKLIQQAARDPAEVLAAASDAVFSMLQFEGLPRAAEPRATRALDESRRLTMPSLEVEAIHWVGRIAYHLGRLDEASALVRQAVTLAERLGPPRRFTVPQLLTVLHAVEASRTDWRSNVAAIERLLATEPDPHFRMEMRTIHLSLIGRFATPDHGDLQTRISAMESDGEAAGCGRCLWEAVLQAAETSARAGSSGAAEEALGRWDASHPEPRPGGPLARRSYIDALLQARRDPEASVPLFTRAARAAEDAGYRLMRLWIDLDATDALARLDRPTALEALGRLALEAEHMGARSEIQLVESRLRGLGARTWRRGPTSSPQALSAREREIAGAVARGASNPEIAESLFVSRKTVERHVSHILAKLGARNRAELAALIAHEDEGVAG